MKRIFLFTITIISSLFISVKSYGQIERPQLISSYIFNFGNEIKWENDDFEEFNILIISSNQNLIDILSEMPSGQEIHGKSISITVNPEPDDDVEHSQLIYISEDKSEYFMTVFDRIEGKEILLISENFDEKSYVMLNLYDTEDGKVLFEINKPNIFNQNLEISDNILLMGGTEIDIAAVYLKSQHSLRNMEKRLNKISSKLDSLNEQTNKQTIQIEKQKTKIKSQLALIDSQKVIEEELLQTTNANKLVIDSQLIRMKEDAVLLEEMTESFNKNSEVLLQQYDEIRKSRDVLYLKNNEIDSINLEIKKRNQILANKDDIIGKQKSRMSWLVMTILISLLFLILIAFAYRNNRRKSLSLLQKREKIRNMNIELNKRNRELNVTLKEIKSMQQQLIQSEKMASLGVLSAGIAHEINNPINFVYAGINSLKRDFEDIDTVVKEINELNIEKNNLDEKIAEIQELKKSAFFTEAYEAIPRIIAQIKLGADRTAEIVKGLRNFSRSDKGEYSDMNIHDGIETSLLLLKNKYKNHIEIFRNFQESNLILKCSPGKINQVLLNILSNAIDAIQDKGSITISTRTKGNDAIISVKDTGCGIKKNLQGKIFDPFFTTKAVGKGTGLGLSISYGIIKEHKGTIDLISEESVGTEFIICLPKS